MKAITQLDQLITNLQGLRASLHQTVRSAADVAQSSAASEVQRSFADVLTSMQAIVAPNETTLVEDPEISGQGQPALSASEDPSVSTVDVLSQRTLDDVSVTPQTFLTTDRGHSRAHRPSVEEFMDATGLAFNDAASLVYVGTSGHADHRNWEKILVSSDPAKAASSANGQQFTSGVDWAPYRDDSSMMDPERIIGQSGNYALYRMSGRSGDNEGYVTLQMVDAEGRRLSQAGVTSEQISRNAWLYGLDKGALNELVAMADTHNPSLAQAMRSAI